MFTAIATIIGVCAVNQAVQEEEAFDRYVQLLPKESQEAARQARKDRIHKEHEESAREKEIEALKPHTLWSWLGVGSK